MLALEFWGKQTGFRGAGAASIPEGEMVGRAVSSLPKGPRWGSLNRLWCRRGPRKPDNGVEMYLWLA